jgi:hypothetical protein
VTELIHFGLALGGWSLLALIVGLVVYWLERWQEKKRAAYLFGRRR